MPDAPREKAVTGPNAIGAYRVIGSLTEKKHPADGLTVTVQFGDGAVGTIANPQSYADGGPAWRMTWGDPLSIRYSVASLLSSYDYLLSENINMAEATRRLRLMRRARHQLYRTTIKDTPDAE